MLAVSFVNRWCTPACSVFHRCAWRLPVTFSGLQAAIPALDALTPAWRAAVERLASTAAGLAPARLARFGYG